MQRYRLTRSGVCDCMLKDDNGPWVMFKEADQALHQARREAVVAACLELIERSGEEGV